MAKVQSPVSHSTMLVLAAACAAYRINGGYWKSNVDLSPGYADPLPPGKQSNRRIMDQLLSNPDELTDSDHSTAEAVRVWYRGKLFQILGNRGLSAFDSKVLSILEQPTCSTNFDRAVLVSVPHGYQRAQRREYAEERMRTAQGGHVGQPKQKVELTCEPLRQIYSQKWETWYITAITPEDQVILFSSRDELPDMTLRIKGTVKCHEPNLTRLTRCRVVGL